MQILIGKVLSDMEFAQALIAEPEAVLRANDVEPTPELLAAIGNLDAAAIQRLAAAFGDDKAA